MEILVVGAGSIGKRHIRNLLAVGIRPENISVIDPREDRREGAFNLGIKALYEEIDTALRDRKFCASIICSPTSMHIPQALELVGQGVNLLIEKPLSHNLNGAKELIQAANRADVSVLVGYIFRFSPLTAKVVRLLANGAIGKVLYVRGEFSEFLPDWHPYEDYRSFYMAEQSQGGGSLLDQSHVIDLVHYLCGSFRSVYAVNKTLSSLEINADDFAELIVTLEDGIIASIHTDIFGRDYKKQLEIKGEEGNIYWDFYANTVSIYRCDSRSCETYKQFPTDFNLTYIDEIRHFLACCEKKEQPLASLQNGIETMSIIEAAKRSRLSGAIEVVEKL